MYFMLPECKDRTYAELDVLFENKVSARKFHKVDVDQFSGHSTEIQFDRSSTDTVNNGDQEKIGDTRKEQV